MMSDSLQNSDNPALQGHPAPDGRHNTVGIEVQHTGPLDTLLEHEEYLHGHSSEDAVGALLSEETPLLWARRGDAEACGEESILHALWEETVILLRYTLPVFGTHFLEFSLSLASVIALGHLNTTSLAAASLASMTGAVTGLSIIHGMASALDTVLPSAWTSPHPDLVGLWTQRMTVVMTATLIPIFFIWFNAERILLTIKQDPEVAHLAGIYLRWLSLSLPAYGFNSISRRYFQSQGLFAVPTRIVVAAAPINIVLTYLLVWGPDSVRLGFVGAPISTTISVNLISIASIFYGVFFTPRTAWHPLSRRAFSNLGMLVGQGLAGVAQVGAEWWSWELNGLSASFLGPMLLASQNVMLQSSASMFQVPYSLSIAACVRIGNLLGEKDHMRAHTASQAALILAAVFGMMSSAIFVIFPRQWASIFSTDEDVLAAVVHTLPLVAVFQLFDGIGCACGAILRSQGKQITAATLNLTARCIFIPFGIWLAFRGHMGLDGLWTGVSIALFFVSVGGIWIVLKTDWTKEMLKVQARIAEEQKQRRLYQGDSDA
ncbi:MATE efflux family protein [Punctularia strigosozonata HHB-11173 SS5]|uniref:MATE efflux family protein n=1 Tax=Punctularia strigosozonata (strain HHB-11173) TaxID=741275 RepID=UPI00044167F8|nr:MATE efflux family protein [Punctularia strigosozonata HHB-11173 SS5]EIN09165.1 MATE efflux family protein [Punctularia strigosozonata HHB-11173 SS5]